MMEVLLCILVPLLIGGIAFAITMFLMWLWHQTFI